MTNLDMRVVRDMVERFVSEDVGRGDLSTTAVVSHDLRGRARIEAREPAVIAGLDVARLCFEIVEGDEIEWTPMVDDGDRVVAGQVLLRLDARLATILTAERTALNLLARMSGVATMTAHFDDAVLDTPARILDTRKTTPGLRLLEKYAVRVGGGHNHRFGLDDGILIKDNHVAVAGGVSEAVARARRRAPHAMRIEVEVGSLDELDAALAAGADAVLLDNMSPELVAAAVTRAGGKVLLEASGGISPDNVRRYATAGVDFISIGALTHSARAIDLSLEVE